MHPIASPSYLHRPYHDHTILIHAHTMVIPSCSYHADSCSPSYQHKRTSHHHLFPSLSQCHAQSHEPISLLLSPSCRHICLSIYLPHRLAIILSLFSFSHEPISLFSLSLFLLPCATAPRPALAHPSARPSFLTPSPHPETSSLDHTQRRVTAS